MSETTTRAELGGEVHVAAGARLEATVYARSVVIEGAFTGRVTAATLEFGATAHAEGTFLADTIAMREGAFVFGTFNMPEQAADEQTEQARAEPSTEGAEPEPEAAAEDLTSLAEAEPVSAAVN